MADETADDVGTAGDEHAREAFFLDDDAPPEWDEDTPTPEELRLAATQARIYADEERALELDEAAERLERVEKEARDLEAAQAWEPSVVAAPPLAPPKGLEDVPPLDAEERARLNRLFTGMTAAEPANPAIVERLRSRTITGDAITSIPPPTPLIAGYLEVGTLAFLYGAPGAGKSLLTLDWALSVSSGSWWHGKEVRQGPVLYVLAEGAAGMGARYKAWLKRNNIFDGAPLFGGLSWLLDAPNLFDAEKSAAFVAYAISLAPALIILDTFARCIVGADENSAKETGFIVGNLERLRDATGATVLAAHHTPKGGDGMRGSTALEGAADTAIEVKNTDGIVTVTPTKQKNTGLIAEARFAIIGEEDTDSVVLSPHFGGAARDVLLSDLPAGPLKSLRAIADIDTGDGVSYSEWKMAAPVADATVARARKTLLDLGGIEEVKSGRSKKYRLTEAGRAVL